MRDNAQTLGEHEGLSDRARDAMRKKALSGYGA